MSREEAFMTMIRDMYLELTGVKKVDNKGFHRSFGLDSEMRLFGSKNREIYMV